MARSKKPRRAPAAPRIRGAAVPRSRKAREAELAREIQRLERAAARAASSRKRELRLQIAHENRSLRALRGWDTRRERARLEEEHDLDRPEALSVVRDARILREARSYAYDKRRAAYRSLWKRYDQDFTALYEHLRPYGVTYDDVRAVALGGS